MDAFSVIDDLDRAMWRMEPQVHSMSENFMLNSDKTGVSIQTSLEHYDSSKSESLYWLMLRSIILTKTIYLREGVPETINGTFVV